MSTKIYTKTGDRGKTSLFDGTRVTKDNIRLETYGTFDELSSILGIAQSFLQETKNKKQETKKIIILLQSIQRDLLDIGARLANPQKKIEKSFAIYLDARIEFFEKTIDRLTAKLPALTHFILFTGNTPSSFLQLSRSVARRCERRLVTLSQKEKVDPSFIRYFNRLSDLLYTLGRSANKGKKEVKWEPFA